MAILLGQVDFDDKNNASRVIVVLDEQIKIEINVADCVSDSEIFLRIKKVVDDVRSRSNMKIKDLAGQDITDQVYSSF